jgi:primosomal protein N' (replication factor Y)
LNQGYEAYARWLLAERQDAGLPPAGYQALLRAEAHDRSHAQQFLDEAAEIFPSGQTRVYGPVPAIMERVGGRSRMYLVVQGANRSALHRQLDQWLPGLRKLPSGRKVRWAIDVDPQEL